METPETEHEWAKSLSEINTYIFEDDTYFIQMAPLGKASLWGANSQEVPYAKAAPNWILPQLPLLLHKRLIFQLAGLHLCAPHPALL